MRQQGDQKLAAPVYAQVSAGYAANLGPTDAETLMALLCEANNARELATKTFGREVVTFYHSPHPTTSPGSRCA